MAFIPVMENKSKQKLVIRIKKINPTSVCVGGGVTKTNSNQAKAYFLAFNNKKKYLISIFCFSLLQHFVCSSFNDFLMIIFFPKNLFIVSLLLCFNSSFHFPLYIASCLVLFERLLLSYL